MTIERPDSINGQRVRNGKGHESLRREMLQDPKLSFRALGVLTYLLSLPDTWKTDSERLAKSRPGREGRAAIRTALQELEAAGYLRRDRRRGPRGLWVWSWRYTDDPTTLIDDQHSDVPPEGKTAGHSIDQLSTDGSSADGNLVDTRDTREEVSEEIESKQSAAAAAPSTSPLTDQDQNIDRWRDHAAQTRSADPPHDDPEDVWNLPPNRYGPTPETTALIGQGEKWQRLYDLIEATAGELDHNEAHAVEAMLDRGDHWQKITRWVCNNRGYDTTTATALIARITRRDVA